MQTGKRIKMCDHEKIYRRVSSMSPLLENQAKLRSDRIQNSITRGAIIVLLSVKHENEQLDSFIDFILLNFRADEITLTRKLSRSCKL